MATYVYDLLTVEVPNSHSWSVRARGYLANQKIDLVHKYALPMRLAGAVARLRRQPEMQLLGLEITADPATRKVYGRPTGVLAPLFRRRVQRLCNNINRSGPPIATHNGFFVYTLYQPPVPSERMINHLARVLLEGRQPPRPTTCTLQVTTRCQLNCSHCSAARFKTNQREELSTEQWINAIRQAEDLGVNNVVFTGGEPLLRKDILELVRAVDPQRANVAMFTNGLLLTDEVVTALREAGLFSLMVSLDDVRPEVHDHLRRMPGSFAKATAGIKRALEGGLLVGISTYARPQDVHEGRLEQMIEFARELGVHEITIFDTVPTGKLLALKQNELLSADDKMRLIALEKDYNARVGYPHVITQAFINGPQGVGCFAAYIQFYITAYGDVNPCDFTPLTFGNIQDEPLETIWSRMLSHPAYCRRSDHCRMQDPEFRRRYIDQIPPNALLPWAATDDLPAHAHCPQKCAGHHSLAVE
ncbi:MAG: radical SAM/SPASM domain-containing protein [Candidatus Zipacnadales bacterium]